MGFKLTLSLELEKKGWHCGECRLPPRRAAAWGALDAARGPELRNAQKEEGG